MATIVNPNLDEDQDVQQPAAEPVVQSGGQAAPTQAQPTQRQGSGRFTNLQKYLNANQQAGQQIAGKVGGKLQSGISEKKDKAQDYYSKLGDSVNKAKNVAGQGGNFMQQLQSIGTNIEQGGNQGFGVQDFAQSPQFDQFQNIQSGRGIDEQLLASQQADASRSAQDYQQASQQALEGLGSEGGRFDLLKKTFGGNVNPQYSTGSQRLDQLFLARQGLGGLQEQISQDLKSAKDLSRQTTQTGAEVGSIASQEQQLMRDIAQQTGANEQSYLDVLKSGLGEARERGVEQYEQARNRIEGGKLAAQDTALFGGDPSQNIYNLNLGDYLNQSVADPTLAGITSEDQLNRYNALRNIAGSDPSASPFAGQEVGTYSPVQVNQEAFQRDLAAASSNLRGLEDTAQDSLSGILSNLNQGNEGRYQTGLRNIRHADFAGRSAADHKKDSDSLAAALDSIESNNYGSGDIQTLLDLLPTRTGDARWNPLTRQNQQQIDSLRSIIDQYTDLSSGRTLGGNLQNQTFDIGKLK